jgi:parvulin-like peptidyl-prolyl isomerase
MILLLSFLLLAISIGNAQNGPVPVKTNNLLNESDILAEYDGGVITRKDLDDKISKIPPNAQGRYRTVEGQIQVLDIMAVEEAFMAKALQMGVDKDPDVEQKINDGKRQFLIQDYYTRNITEKLTITEADKLAYYNENMPVFYLFPNVTIQHVQLSDAESAQTVYRALTSGEDFTAISEKYNTNTYSKNLKGVIKNIRMNGNIPGIGNDLDLEKAIQEASGAVNIFQVPIQTSTGWHVFRVTEFVEGRQKAYDEVLPEIEQRVRPQVENRMLDELTAALELKYNAVTDTTLLASIDLMNPNKEGLDRSAMIVTSSDPAIQISVQQLLDIFSRISDQEKIFYTKGGGAQQLLNNELVRNLLYVDALHGGYEQNIADNPDYVQMKRYYILNSAFRKLVLDKIEVSPEEINKFYTDNAADYTTPASRSIQILWFGDERTANHVRRKIQRALAHNDEERVQRLIMQYSDNPGLSVLGNQYNNGIVTGIGPDAEFSKMIWNNPLNYLSPTFKTARGDIVFFRNLSETPATVRNQTELEPQIYGKLRKDKETFQQEAVTQQLFTEFNMRKYPERITLLLSADELFSLADEAARNRNFTDAITYYDQITANYKNGVDDYKAFFMKAFIVAEELKNTTLALDLFKSFLRQFPQGELNESAQFMIDSLEGNTELIIEE